MGVIERFKNSWNLMKELDSGSYLDYGSSMPRNPDSPQLTSGNERSIITSVFTQIAIDVSNVRIEHARVDEQGQYLETIMDSLNYCLTKEANLDPSRSKLCGVVRRSCIRSRCGRVSTWYCQSVWVFLRVT